MTNNRLLIVNRAVKEIEDGMNVNLGIGMPLLIPNYIPEDYNVMLQFENGLLGICADSYIGEEDTDLINVGKETVTFVPGKSFFDSSESFSMIRNGHIDIAILGDMEVAEEGDLASEAKRVVVIMDHVNKHGKSNVKKKCTLPLTGKSIVQRLITELAVFDFTSDGMVLTELQGNATLEEVKAKTETDFTVSSNLEHSLTIKFNQELLLKFNAFY